MSTRATITAKCSDGKYRCIYVNYDGYIQHRSLDGVGAKLYKHYTEQGKIEALVNLGALIQLGTCTATCQPFPVQADEEMDIGEGKSAKAAVADRGGYEEYNYSWNGASWAVNGRALKFKGERHAYRYDI